MLRPPALCAAVLLLRVGSAWAAPDVVTLVSDGEWGAGDDICAYTGSMTNSGTGNDTCGPEDTFVVAPGVTATQVGDLIKDGSEPIASFVIHGVLESDGLGHELRTAPGGLSCNSGSCTGIDVAIGGAYRPRGCYRSRGEIPATCEATLDAATPIPVGELVACPVPVGAPARTFEPDCGAGDASVLRSVHAPGVLTADGLLPAYLAAIEPDDGFMIVDPNPADVAAPRDAYVTYSVTGSQGVCTRPDNCYFEIDVRGASRHAQDHRVSLADRSWHECDLAAPLVTGGRSVAVANGCISQDGELGGHWIYFQRGLEECGESPDDGIACKMDTIPYRIARSEANGGQADTFLLAARAGVNRDIEDDCEHGTRCRVWISQVGFAFGDVGVVKDEYQITSTSPITHDSQLFIMGEFTPVAVHANGMGRLNLEGNGGGGTLRIGASNADFRATDMSSPAYASLTFGDCDGGSYTLNRWSLTGGNASQATCSGGPCGDDESGMVIEQTFSQLCTVRCIDCVVRHRSARTGQAVRFYGVTERLNRFDLVRAKAEFAELGTNGDIWSFRANEGTVTILGGSAVAANAPTASVFHVTGVPVVGTLTFDDVTVISTRGGVTTNDVPTTKFAGTRLAIVGGFFSGAAPIQAGNLQGGVMRDVSAASGSNRQLVDSLSATLSPLVQLGGWLIYHNRYTSTGAFTLDRADRFQRSVAVDNAFAGSGTIASRVLSLGTNTLAGDACRLTDLVVGETASFVHPTAGGPQRTFEIQDQDAQSCVVGGIALFNAPQQGYATTPAATLAAGVTDVLVWGNASDGSGLAEVAGAVVQDVAVDFTERADGLYVTFHGALPGPIVQVAGAGLPADAWSLRVNGLAPEAVIVPVCSNGLDDDGDGLVDAPVDPGCADIFAPNEGPQCQDGIDNDGDALVDFDGGQSVHGVCSGGSCPPGVSDPNSDGTADPDPQCAGPTGSQEKKNGCGLGAELVLLWPVLAALRRRRSRGAGNGVG